MYGLPELYRDELRGAERTPEDSAVGVVGAGRLAQEIAARGFYFDLIYMLCGLTILIGIMNLLPLPPLDGGHLAVVAWEAVTRRSVDLRKIIPVAAAVIAHDFADGLNTVSLMLAHGNTTRRSLLLLALDALAPFGVTHLDMPLTPQKIWQAVKAAKK